MLDVKAAEQWCTCMFCTSFRKAWIVEVYESNVNVLTVGQLQVLFGPCMQFGFTHVHL